MERIAKPALILGAIYVSVVVATRLQQNRAAFH
jgi:hypothetical protein